MSRTPLRSSFDWPDSADNRADIWVSGLAGVRYFRDCFESFKVGGVEFFDGVDGRMSESIPFFIGPE